MSTRTANKAKATTKVDLTKAKPKQAKPAKRPVEALATPENTQKSIRVHFEQATNADGSLWLPKGNGGVKFTEKASKDGQTVLGTVYVDQPSWALLGKPKSITVDVKAA